eukprot:GHVU01107781.1.p1 GENE.GHVU01107781.1~~GHVU01107781.1.p1  ORF type:complete len:134 (+),score=5.18 GHVU01107781.1:809-1210(+)
MSTKLRDKLRGKSDHRLDLTGINMSRITCAAYGTAKPLFIHSYAYNELFHGMKLQDSSILAILVATKLRSLSFMEISLADASTVQPDVPHFMNDASKSFALGKHHKHYRYIRCINGKHDEFASYATLAHVRCP